MPATECMLNKGCDKDAEQKNRKGALWTGSHLASGLPVTITTRMDRQPLMSIFWGPNQVCQLPIRRFENQDICLLLLKEIAVDFCSGKLTKDQLYLTRDELAKSKYDVNLKARVRFDDGAAAQEVAKKRPAAATQLVATVPEPADSQTEEPPPKTGKAGPNSKARSSSASSAGPAVAQPPEGSWMNDIPVSPFDNLTFLFG